MAKPNDKQVTMTLTVSQWREIYYALGDKATWARDNLTWTAELTLLQEIVRENLGSTWRAF